MADSFFSFSDLPIIALFWAGVIGLVFAGLLGLVTLIARLAGAIDQPGYATLVIAVLALFSILIASQGIMGMYLWRAFENSKGLPPGIVMDRYEWPSGSQPGPQTSASPDRRSPERSDSQ